MAREPLEQTPEMLLLLAVYRQGQPAECLENPETLQGDPVLRGFVLDVRDIW